MSRKVIEMVGRKFGKLTVIRQEGRTNAGKLMYVCKCDCGEITKPIDGRDLRRGRTQSCGCIIDKGYNSQNNKLYAVWSYMKTRCNNENCKDYKNYGARGIKVCSEWESDFLTFQKWAIDSGYEEGLTIDRINTYGNYKPSNCRWTTQEVQQNNKTNNIMITIGNLMMTATQWARFIGVTPSTIFYHIKKNDVYEFIESKLEVLEVIEESLSTEIDIFSNCNEINNTLYA